MGTTFVTTARHECKAPAKSFPDPAPGWSPVNILRWPLVQRSRSSGVHGPRERLASSPCPLGKGLLERPTSRDPAGTSHPGSSHRKNRGTGGRGAGGPEGIRAGGPGRRRASPGARTSAYSRAMPAACRLRSTWSAKRPPPDETRKVALLGPSAAGARSREPHRSHWDGASPRAWSRDAGGRIHGRSASSARARWPPPPRAESIGPPRRHPRQRPHASRADAVTGPSRSGSDRRPGAGRRPAAAANSRRRPGRHGGAARRRTVGPPRDRRRAGGRRRRWR